MPTDSKGIMPQVYLPGRQVIAGERMNAISTKSSQSEEHTALHSTSINVRWGTACLFADYLYEYIYIYIYTYIHMDSNQYAYSWNWTLPTRPLSSISITLFAHVGAHNVLQGSAFECHTNAWMRAQKKLWPCAPHPFTGPEAKRPLFAAWHNLGMFLVTALGFQGGAIRYIHVFDE